MKSLVLAFIVLTFTTAAQAASFIACVNVQQSLYFSIEVDKYADMNPAMSEVKYYEDNKEIFTEYAYKIATKNAYTFFAPRNFSSLKVSLAKKKAEIEIKTRNGSEKVKFDECKIE